MNELYSPNRSIHIGNLEKALSEARAELEKVTVEVAKLKALLKSAREWLTKEQSGSAQEFNELLAFIDEIGKAVGD